MIGLRDQTVRDARDIDDGHARHRWNIPHDYSVVGDCLLRHLQDRADDTCLVFDDDLGRVQHWSWRQMVEASPRRGSFPPNSREHRSTRSKWRRTK